MVHQCQPQPVTAIPSPQPHHFFGYPLLDQSKLCQLTPEPRPSGSPPTDISQFTSSGHSLGNPDKRRPSLFLSSFAPHLPQHKNLGYPAFSSLVQLLSSPLLCRRNPPVFTLSTTTFLTMSHKIPAIVSSCLFSSNWSFSRRLLTFCPSSGGAHGQPRGQARARHRRQVRRGGMYPVRHFSSRFFISQPSY